MMRIRSGDFEDGGRIPTELAFCQPHPETRVVLSENINPELGWGGEPEATKSFVLICRDPNVPVERRDVNREGKVLEANLPRSDFFHWVLVDIPRDLRHIEQGIDCDGVTPGGKEAGPCSHGARRGLNDYSTWFDPGDSMAGSYFGYDGPCPPWNDSMAHRYIFTVYALDTERCPVGREFDGRDVVAAIQGHILDEASITGFYSLNPNL
ncbi:MAG: YbhB/YbcL family Raf kinase inhibitor-like protein [Pseudomonadota bacterium]|nr:YbhB/YbcL family Raf kinase inhibitor-like protein [Pseudomonadota bacterium]